MREIFENIQRVMKEQEMKQNDEINIINVGIRMSELQELLTGRGHNLRMKLDINKGPIPDEIFGPLEEDLKNILNAYIEQYVIALSNEVVEEFKKEFESRE